MQPRLLKASNIEISPIIMGTWQAGKAQWTGIDDKETTRAVRAAFDEGVTTFDTAEVYGNGHSEQIVGNALKGLRDQVVLATKVFSNHLAYDQVIDACHRSLKNLGTEVIDLYQIHWPPGSFGHKKVPMGETMEALNKLKEQEKIRAIGVSNFNSEQMAEAAQYGPIESLQPPYNLFWRMIEKEALPYCRANDMIVLTYSPMAQGLLTGKFGPDHRFDRGDHRAANRLFQPEHYARVQDALARFKPIAEDYGITLGQLALAWVLSQENCCAVAGARNAGQAVENAGAAHIRLEPETLEELDRISRTVTDHLDDNPMQWTWK
jgi:aryl-alcohol dehydrogenase-like predicted oxidoreductase